MLAVQKRNFPHPWRAFNARWLLSIMYSCVRQNAGTFAGRLLQCLALVALICSVLPATAEATQGPGWAKNFNGIDGSVAEITATAVDAAGNTYITGAFWGSTLAVGAVTLTQIGVRDMVVAKFDATGAVLWAKNYGGSEAETSATAIAVDASGNVYLSGNFRFGSLTTPALSIIGTQDAFIVKLDSSGATSWAKNFGGSGAQNFGQSIAVDAAGSVFLGGYFFGANLTAPALARYNSGGTGYVFKFDTDGTSIWNKRFGGNQGPSGADLTATAIAADAVGNVYLTGYFGSWNLTNPALIKIGDYDVFVFKLSAADGSTTWAKNFGGSATEAKANAIAVDATGTNIYLGGTFDSGNLSSLGLTQIGTGDGFAAKLDASGTMVWAKNFGGSGAYTYGNAIAVDSAGKVYLAGTLQDANLTTPALSIIGRQDAFVVKLETNGDTSWAKNYGGVSAATLGNTIAVDSAANVYLGGTFQYTNLSNPALTKIGQVDAFAIRLDASGNTSRAASFGCLTSKNAYTRIAATAIDAAGNTYITGHLGTDVLTLGAITLSKIGASDVFVAKLDASGTVLWAHNYGGANGSGAYANGNAIAVDSAGNVYLGGDILYAPFTTPPMTQVSGAESFVFKLDTSGTIVWAKNFGGAGGITAKAIAVDGTGNVYLGGAASGNLTNPVLTVIGYQDAYVFKLNPSGTTVWAKNFGGSGASAMGNALAVSANGTVYLSGNSSANLTTPALTAIGNQDAFAFKIDASGVIIWAKNFGGSGAIAEGNGIAIDSSGNAYLTGNSDASMSTPVLTKIGVQDAFAIKLDAINGTSTWSQNFGGNGATATGRNIAVDSVGNAYLGGDFQNASLSAPALTAIGVLDAMVIKLDTSSGNLISSKSYGGSLAMTYGYGLAVGSAGDIYLGGRFTSADLTTPALTLIGGQDAFILKEATSPAAPTISSVSAGNQQVTVTFAAPTGNGGDAISGYTVTSNPAGGVDSNAGSTSLSHLITGLTNGVAYTFTVTATNGVGAGTPSAASTSVMPNPPTTTSVTSSANPSAFGQSVTFTAVVSGNVPHGTVTFKDGSTVLCNNLSLFSGSTRQCVASSLSLGSHNITVEFNGDESNSPSISSVLTQVVNKGGVTVGIASHTPSPSTIGGAIAVTVNVQALAPAVGTPTGTISVSDGSASCFITLPA
ncbi:MAG: SBBP repeat-containing protein, partial [Pseudomonadota bacterium]